MAKCRIIWLDPSINSSKIHIAGKKQLQELDNNLLTFDDDAKCLKRIMSMPNDSILLIVSGSLGRIIVPKVIKYDQVIGIYVFCLDIQTNKEWSRQYPKVKCVVNNPNDLFHHIQSRQPELTDREVDELIISTFNVSTQLEGQSSTELNGQFVHFQLLIECLLRMNESPNEKQEFIKHFKQEFDRKEEDLQHLKEFEKTYTSRNALNWYTKNTFLYRSLNKALRLQDIDLLYLFRFFIRDLVHGLEERKCLSSIQVYRGQLMSEAELDLIRDSGNQFISFNSFMSTSEKRKVANTFLPKHTVNNKVKVLLKIDADPQTSFSKAFSNITKHSDYQEESEILFSIGSIFQVLKKSYDSNKVCNIRLKLCSFSDVHLKELYQHLEETLGDRKTNLFIFAGVLRNMGKLKEAEKYYQLFMSELPSNHPSIYACYHALIIVSCEQKKFEESQNWYCKLQNFKCPSLNLTRNETANIHNSIAIVYQQMGRYEDAIQFFEKALAIWKVVYGEDHLDVAMCLSNLGNVKYDYRQYHDALKYHEDALKIRQKHLPVYHSDIGTSYTNIANVYAQLDDFKKASTYYTNALHIYEKSLPPYHPNIAMTLENIGIIEEQRNNNAKALSSFQNAIKIFHHSMPDSHPKIQEVKDAITRVSSKSNKTGIDDDDDSS